MKNRDLSRTTRVLQPAQNRREPEGHTLPAVAIVHVVQDYRRVSTDWLFAWFSTNGENKMSTFLGSDERCC